MCIRDSDKAIELNPTYATAYYNRGNVLNKLNRKEEALGNYDKAIELNPTYTTAYNNRGWLNLILEQYVEAQSTFQKLWELLNGKTTFHAPMNLGHALLLQQKEKEAINWYQKAISLCKDKEELATFFQGMQEDYQELKMKAQGISINTYDDILQQLKNNKN